MRYLSEDGKVFNTAEECAEHEKKNNKQEKDRRKQEIKEAADKYYDLLEQYTKDYGLMTDSDDTNKNKNDFLELMKLLSLI